MAKAIKEKTGYIDLTKHVESLIKLMGKIEVELNRGGILDEELLGKYQTRLKATLKELYDVIFAIKKNELLLAEVVEIGELAQREKIVKPLEVIKICSNIKDKLAAEKKKKIKTH